MKIYPVGNPDAYDALDASITAYTYCFIDALRKSGKNHSIVDEQSVKIATQLLLGSAKMIAESQEHPWELVDRVCSPGGTTIEGVVSLQKDAFESKVIQAFDSSL